MENKRILITGATGNVGLETIRGLKEINTKHQIIAAGSNVSRTRMKLSQYDFLSFREFDFTNPQTFERALHNVDIVFLLRPPHLADITKYFEPLISAMIQNRISKVVFLSVQGVENQPKIPHYKLEKLILESNMEYVFLRPSYFMQNLTTTLLHEIKTEKKIVVPAGKLKFNWVDVRDIGMVSACVLNDFKRYKNSNFEITGSDFTDFQEVAEKLTKHLGFSIKYDSPNLLRFYIKKRRQGVSNPMIFVMIMLHYLPRFEKNENRLTNVVKEICGKEPGTLEQFILREKEVFLNTH